MPDTPNPEREGRILDAASRLIAHYGYDKTTMSDIAGAAGVSKGALYLHWKSKDALFEALILYESGRVLDDLIRQIDAAAELTSIFSIFGLALQVTTRNPLIHALVTKDARVLGDFTRKLDSAFMADANLFRLEFVRHLQAARVIRDDLSAELIAHFMAIVRYGYLTIGEVVPAAQQPPIDAVGEALALLLDTALRPVEGGDPEAARQIIVQALAAMRPMLEQMKTKGSTSA
jgi:TetR/AcrR family acrAB operon transcriptional repressor